MATAQDIVNEWAAGDEEKQQLVIRSGLPLRWLNQGQLRYFDKSEVLRGVWTPTITSSGNIALPSDFLREFPNRVKRDVSDSSDLPLGKIDYPDANLMDFSALTHYSIWNGTFYVWSAGACTPSVPYIKKPAVLASFASDLSVPTEFQHNLIIYLDAHWVKIQKDIAGHYALMKEFDNQARQDGVMNIIRNNQIPTIRGSWF